MKDYVSREYVKRGNASKGCVGRVYENREYLAVKNGR